MANPTMSSVLPAILGIVLIVIGVVVALNVVLSTWGDGSTGLYADSVSYMNDSTTRVIMGNGTADATLYIPAIAALAFVGVGVLALYNGIKNAVSI